MIDATRFQFAVVGYPDFIIEAAPGETPLAAYCRATGFIESPGSLPSFFEVDPTAPLGRVGAR